MAKNEEMLEELYELLTLYFEFSPGGNFVKTFSKPQKIEPALDRIIFKEQLLREINRLLNEEVKNYER